ncbi:MAG: hypothetical protein R3A13_11680 [Bdellovibrionota bacterium]
MPNQKTHLRKRNYGFQPAQSKPASRVERTAQSFEREVKVLDSQNKPQNVSERRETEIIETNLNLQQVATEAVDKNIEKPKSKTASDISSELAAIVSGTRGSVQEVAAAVEGNVIPVVPREPSSGAAQANAEIQQVPKNDQLAQPATQISKLITTV